MRGIVGRIFALMALVGISSCVSATPQNLFENEQAPHPQVRARLTAMGETDPRLFETIEFPRSERDSYLAAAAPATPDSDAPQLRRALHRHALPLVEDNFVLHFMRAPNTRLYAFASFLLIVGNICAAIPSKAFDYCGENKDLCMRLALCVKVGLFVGALNLYKYIRERA